MSSLRACVTRLAGMDELPVLITGEYGTGKGVVARGVRKVAPEATGAPASPGPVPELVPLKDGSGAALPPTKGAVWRAPVASGFDGWIWFDDTSKDQLVGYNVAVGGGM